MMNPVEKEILSLLKDSARSRSAHQVFGDACEMFFNAISKNMAMNAEEAETREKAYMRVVETYTSRNEHDIIREIFPKLLALFTMEIQKDPRDLFGTIAAELSALSSEMGQFYTPTSISELMAGLTLPSEEEVSKIVEENGYISVCDPASGSGSTIIGLFRNLSSFKENFDIVANLYVETTDLSPLAFHMCYVQLSLLSIPAKVIYGNTLTLEVFDHAYTPAFPKHYESRSK